MNVKCILTEQNPTEPKVEYSTEEKIVGTWIDGSPLRQQTFSFHIDKGTKKDAHLYPPIPSSYKRTLSMISINGVVKVTDPITAQVIVGDMAASSDKFVIEDRGHTSLLIPGQDYTADVDMIYTIQFTATPESSSNSGSGSGSSSTGSSSGSSAGSTS